MGFLGGLGGIVVESWGDGVVLFDVLFEVVFLVGVMVVLVVGGGVFLLFL